MFLDGFALAGYRSFGEEMVYISDLSKVNIFIGKNNCGKSNILRFCKHLSRIRLKQAYTGFDDKLDRCIGAKEKEIRFALQVKKNSTATGNVYNEIEGAIPILKEISELQNKLWIFYSVSKLTEQPERSFLANLIKKYIESPETLHKIFLSLGTSYNEPARAANEIAARIYNTHPWILFRIYTVDAFRKISQKGNQSDTSILDGQNLIEKLRWLQSPTLEHMQDKDKFAKINRFLCEIIGEENAYLEIPAAKDEIYVNIKDKILPLDNLGTGIHEVIILAAAVTVFDKSVFCIEEPEIHIHPELQKKFLNYIKNSTDNQYLISTHSNAFFDITGVNIYHCWLDEKEHTKCELVSSDHEKSTVLSNLGYKPSDILQSNFIIWVEGPSDRIYINWWIHGRPDGAPLVEGLHYSIMFYGGRLLSHLTFDEQEIEEFIQLCKLNRHAAIVIDRDTDSAHKRINQTKKRVMENFEQNRCVVWITAGREIENYIGETAYNKALRESHQTLNHNVKCGRFKKITNVRGLKVINKLSIAKKVAQMEQDYSTLDLNERVDELIERIKAANV